LVSDYSFSAAMFTGVGELALGIWFVMKFRRVAKTEGIAPGSVDSFL